MDLFQLTYFIEVAHKKSFTKASKSLHISQPSISKGIKAMEDHWNIQLFDRKGKNVELTETGAYLLPKVEELMKGFTQLNEEMGSTTLLNAGKLIIGIPPMIASSSISPFIRQFMTSYPHIELEIAEVGSQKIISAIDDDLIQAGFVALPIDIDMPYDFFIFNKEPLDVVVWSNHPLAEQKELTLQQIKDEPLVSYPATFSLTPYIRSFYQEIMAQPKIVCRSSNWEFLIEMVRSQMGIALLPQSICKRMSHDVVHIPLVEPHISWTLALIWKSRGFLSHPARTWVQAFKDYFQHASSQESNQHPSDVATIDDTINPI